MPGANANHPELVLTFAAQTLLAADFDGDLDVDGDDLSRWAGDFGGSGADADGDGDSDGADFLAWQRQFGNGIASAASSQGVPEPATSVLLAWLLLGGSAGRRRSFASGS